MSDDLGTRLADLRRGAASPAAAEEATEAEEVEELLPGGSVAFARLLSPRRPELMLELRRKSGDALALGYAYLVSIGFNRSGGLVLEFTGHQVKIKGRNLRPLWRGLVQQRVAWLQELDPMAEAAQEETATTVTEISVEEA
jgi:hypothetical protein